MSEQKQIQKKQENPMRAIKLEKVILSCGATGPDLEKSQKLLELLSGKKAQIVKAGPKRRIPSFGVKPNLPLGTMVTLRGEDAEKILIKLLGAIDNTLDESQIAKNAFSFGIKEYIEIPGIEYKRDIGIRGLNITVVFTRAGFRIKKRKIKCAKLPEKQTIKPEEIIEFLEENFDTEVE